MLSQHTGATAVVTAEAQVPMMTGTLSTSISLRAARTAASGLVWSSSHDQLDLASQQAARGVDLVRHRLHRLEHARAVEAAGAGERRQHAETQRRALRAHDGRRGERGRRLQQSTAGEADHRILPLTVRSASRRGRCGGSPDRRRARRPHHRGCCGRRQGWWRDARSPAPAVAFCSTIAIAMPSRLIARMVANSVSAAIGDSPAEGSSSSSSTGCTISAIAMASIWRWPPDSVRAARPRRSASIGKRANTLVDAPARRGGIEPAAHLQVLAHRQRGEDVLLLRHEGDAEAADLARRAGRGSAAPRSVMLPLRGMQQAGDGLQQRRFAGAVRADDGDDLAVVDREVHALQDFVAAPVAGDDVARDEQRHRCNRHAGTRRRHRRLIDTCNSRCNGRTIIPPSCPAQATNPRLWQDRAARRGPGLRPV